MNKIIWEKWTDPFGDDLDETKWNNYDDEDLDNDAELLDDEYIKTKMGKPVKVIASPVGLIPYNEHTASSKIFNFWVGHTNFNISKTISNIIEKCDGVELLDIFTRYRFRMGIGKCFNDSEIMQNVMTNIDAYLKELSQ
jgi:hypothetical protein